MTPRPPLPPGPYLVVGLARSGLAAARMLAEHGEVIGVDRASPELPDGFEAHLESDGLDLLERARTVVKSPGVPAQAPVIVAARERGIEVLGEVELAWRLIPNEFTAVTGTNGKTTTTVLLGEIYRESGRAVAVAGNVGTALSSFAGALDPAAVVVCETSSFQLEDSSAFAPECGVLLNVEEDHLDRHGTFEAYRDAKLRLFANQGPEHVAVAPAGIELPGRARRAAVELRDGTLVWEGDELLPASEVRLRGAHNLENAMAAAAAALARGVEREAVVRTLAGFAGVPHRLEEVAERGGVLFVNDSKATNPASATVGIRAFDGGVHAILGGSLKGGSFTGLREAVSERCRACYLIGAAADQLERDLRGTVRLHRCGDLEHAVEHAAGAALPGEVVLLSPACASFDRYSNYEERGEHFKALAEALG